MWEEEEQHFVFSFLVPSRKKFTLEYHKSITTKPSPSLFTELLSGTLRTYQRAGCDHEYVQLNCPRGTTISIEFAQYGKYGSNDPNDPGLCPETADDNAQRDGNVINSGTEIEFKLPEKCMWQSGLQVRNHNFSFICVSMDRKFMLSFDPCVDVIRN